MAVFLGKDHWEREPEECIPIAVPAARMINRLPPKKLEGLYKLIDPAMLASGICEVAGPSVRLEIAEYQARAAARTAAKTGRVSPLAAGKSGGNGQHSSNVSGSGQGIPTANAPFIGGNIG